MACACHTFSMRSAESPHTGDVAPSPILKRNVAAVAQLEAADRARQSSAERFSDTIARVAGTPWFAWVHVAWFAAWVVWKRRVRARLAPIDPFPFSFLTLVVSLEAIFLSIFVLISQNKPHPAQRTASASRSPDQPAGGAGTPRRRWRCSSGSPAIGVPLPAESSDSELATPTDIRDVVRSLDSVSARRFPRGEYRG